MMTDDDVAKADKDVDIVWGNDEPVAQLQDRVLQAYNNGWRGSVRAKKADIMEYLKYSHDVLKNTLGVNDLQKSIDAIEAGERMVFLGRPLALEENVR